MFTFKRDYAGWYLYNWHICICKWHGAYNIRVGPYMFGKYRLAASRTMQRIKDKG